MTRQHLIWTFLQLTIGEYVNQLTWCWITWNSPSYCSNVTRMNTKVHEIFVSLWLFYDCMIYFPVYYLYSVNGSLNPSNSESYKFCIWWAGPEQLNASKTSSLNVPIFSNTCKSANLPSPNHPRVSWSILSIVPNSVPWIPNLIDMIIINSCLYLWYHGCTRTDRNKKKLKRT